MSDTSKRKFRLILVKPSHYDDLGYVISWVRSPIPANSLACVYGIASAAAEAGRFGTTDVSIAAYDETNTRIRPARIADDIASHDDGMVMLVGVQSNQFPRALDIARPLREAGIKVGIGGFHVSGTLAMLDQIDPGVQEALDMGCFLFAGEAEEGRLEGVIEDAINGTLQDTYNFMNALPDMTGSASPILPEAVVKRTFGANTSFDAGRGCPFQCSFCTIINVQGRKSRYRSPDDVEAIIRKNVEQGICRFFITDDNFARNTNWEDIFDRLIHLREVEKVPFRCIIQVDTSCHKIPRFIEKAARAGVRRVFIGLENINPENLVGAKKRQNKITDYRTMLLEWKKHGVTNYCGYITGFPGDTRERILSEVRLIMEELPVDILEFFYLTPLPGSEDHKKMQAAGTWMDPDLNKYDLDHRVTHHPNMSDEEWEQTYRDVWKMYYSREHRLRVIKRNAAHGISPGKTGFLVNYFWCAWNIERVHPLETGLIRRRFRADRRPGLPRENPVVFFAREYVGGPLKLARWIASYLSIIPAYMQIKGEMKKNGKRLPYSDKALEPVLEETEFERQMYQSDAAKAAVATEMRVASIVKKTAETKTPA